MKATQLLHNLGQSLWLDNITRDLLKNGTLRRYIDELSVTGLTSNPTIFDHAIKNSSAYDSAILDGLAAGKSGEDLFFDLAIADITGAADLFRPTYDRTNGVDGWVSLEVSPLLAHDTASTLAEAGELFSRARRSNLFIKIPGTKEGLPAIEEAIFSGIPINVTLLFSREQFLAAAQAYLRGIERRIAGTQSEGQFRCVGVRQPVGCGGGRQNSGGVEQSARHRHRPPNVQGLPRPARLAALATHIQRRRPRSAASLGQHGNQGPQGIRYTLHQKPRRAVHSEHDARADFERLRRSR